MYMEAKEMVTDRVDTFSAAEFDDIYRRQVARIFRYAARRVGAELGEEVTARVFVAAWSSRRVVPSTATPAAWLVSLAVRELRRHRGAERSQLRALRRSPAGGEDPSQAAIAAALLALSRGDRELVTTQAWAGLSEAELADALGLPLPSIVPRLRSAHARMAAELEGGRGG
jgi:DNA-directed RNA polymerase specialized sigma24 family protein